MQLTSFFRIGIVVISITTLLACKKDHGAKENTNAITDDSPNYTVSTFAGNGTNGMDPGTGGLALLNNPGAIAFDTQGNLYVADSDNDKVRKVTSSGAMTTLAGSTVGYADGTGATAQFDHPAALALDAQGNVYVAEGGNLRIRKITPAGVVTTIAGNGIAGLVDGPGSAAQIDIPGGMVVDPQGNIFFTQINFHGIRKVSPAGVVSTFVGSSTAGYAEGTGSAARFNEAYSLAIDAQGNIYASDFKNARIRKVTPGGVVTTVVQRANENEMHNITMDANGNFYVVQGDINSTVIVKVNPAGSITKIAGGVVGYSDGPGNTAKFSYITGMAVNSNGDLYVAELFNSTIRKIKRN
jgi:sugar lactone lactonase YvrE